MAPMPFEFDDALLDAVRSGAGPSVRIYPFGFRAVVAGRGSDLEQEIRLDRVRQDNIPLYRRRGGGCSVYLDPGNLIVSLAFPAPGLGAIQALFDHCTQWLIRGLASAGITGVHKDGISDLVLDGRKIAGSCLYRTKGMAYYAAAVLVTPDLDLMARYLKHPPREPAYRRGRSHKDFVAGLDRFFPGLTVGILAGRLNESLDPRAAERAA